MLAAHDDTKHDVAQVMHTLSSKPLIVDQLCLTIELYSKVGAIYYKGIYTNIKDIQSGITPNQYHRGCTIRHNP